MTNLTKCATIILQQLGGNQFIAMTGASMWTCDTNNITIRLKGCRKLNMLLIELNENDLYDLKFFKLNSRTYEIKLKHEIKDIFCDQLQEIFTKYTGLQTHL